MTEQSRHRATPGLAAVLSSLEETLQGEVEVLDAFLLALGRGQLPTEAWSKLHEAARRDDRLAELAFAFEEVAADRRIRTLQASVVAEFMFQAAVFFGDVFGDEMGSTSYLDRAMAALPTHPGAIDRLETQLVKSGDFLRLGDFFADLAGHRPRAEQAELLRKALGSFEQGGAEDRVADVLAQIVRIDPEDAASRARLEEALLRANRPKDVARLLEQDLAADPPPADEVAVDLRVRLLATYGESGELERALPHVEWLLARDPAHAGARAVATALLELRTAAPRAAAALAAAAEAQGAWADAARFLALELEHARGAQRAAALKGLTAVRQDHLDDPHGAYEAADAALALDTSDAELLERYVSLTRALGKHDNSTRTLGRLVGVTKDPVARARLATEMGELLLATGDTKRARAAFSSALSVPGVDEATTLPAAHALARLYAEDEDHVSLADMLERIVRSDPDVVRRQTAGEQLAALATGPLNDPARAIAAWEGLLGTPARARALEALEPLLGSMGDAVGMARVLRLRAEDSSSPDEQRALMFRAAEALTEASGNVAAAAGAWADIVDRFGPSREVVERWLPLLELQGDFTGMDRALTALAELCSGAEKAEALGRLGALRVQGRRDVPGAIRAFRAALEADPTERSSRTALEQMLASQDDQTALAAASTLEAVYRTEASRTGVIRALATVAARADDAEQRLQAIREAVSIAEQLPGEHARATELLSRALAISVAEGQDPSPWIAQLGRLLGQESDASRRADVLFHALGDGAVTSDALLALARAAGDAAMVAGDQGRALSAYRRALSFAPGPDLLADVELLLREQGTPEDRLRLYATALEREQGTERRRGLLLAMANIQRHELGDDAAAMATLRSAMAEGPSDAVEEALLDLYGKTGAWLDICALLEERLSRTPPGDAERTLHARVATVAAEHGLRDRAAAHCRALLEDPLNGSAEIDVIEQVAERLDDGELLALAAARRAELAETEEDRIFWLSRLGAVHTERGDTTAAVAAWRDAAGHAERAGDVKNARKLYERIRKVAPYDRAATERLAALLEAAGEHAPLPELFAALVESASGPEERKASLMRLARVLLERAKDPAGAFDAAARAFVEAPSDPEALALLTRYAVLSAEKPAFFRTLDAALAQGGDKDPALRSRVWAARAEVLAEDPARQAEALAALRAVVDDPFSEPDAKHHAADVCETLLARAQAPDAEAWRWLLGWRAAQASTPQDRHVVLARWARLEEGLLHETGRALDLWRQLSEADAEDSDAATEVARLTLASGDVEGALAALRSRLSHGDEEQRRRVRAEIAGVLLGQGDRTGEALAELRGVLAEAPDHPGALRLLSKLLEDPSVGHEASGLLEASLQGATDTESKSRVLSALVDGAKDAPRERRRAWFEELLELGREQSEEAVYAVLLRACAEFPEEAAFWDRTEQLARRLDRPGELGELYQTVLASGLGTEMALEIGQRAVAFQEEWFEDAAGLIRILNRLVDLDPAGWAFDRLKLLYDSQERWDELFTLYDRVIAAEGLDELRRTDLLEDAAQVAKDFAKNAPRAIGYLEQLLNLRPDSERLIASLERLYERHGRHRELISLLGAQLAGKTEQDAQALRGRMARLWLDELSDGGSALLVVEDMIQHGEDGETSLELLERILSAVPQGEEIKKTLPPTSSPVSERVSAAYESIAPRASSPPRASAPPKTSGKGRGKRVLVRQRTASLLRERYASAGRESDLARMLEVELEAVKNAKERIRRHRELAALYERLSENLLALEHCVALVMLEPDAASHREHLAALAEKTLRFDRLAEVLAAAADDCESDELRASLLFQSGVVQSERLGDDARAAELFFRVLGLGVDDAVLLAAARRLDALLRGGDRDAERLGVLERISELETDAAARKTALGEAAELATRIGAVDRAVAAWEGRLAGDATDLEALSGLIDLLHAQGRFAPLASALGRRAQVLAAAGRDAESRDDRVRAARVQAESLSAEEEAIAGWEGIERDFGEADDASEALAALYEARRDHARLATTLERAAARATDEDRRATLLVRLGDIQREHLDRHDEAIESYARALRASPAHAGAVSGLTALLGREESAEAAVRVLLESYRAGDDWQHVLELLPHRLRVAKDQAERVRVLLEVMEMAERRAGDPHRAFEAARDAFVLSGGEAAIEDEAARLAEATGEWRAYVDAHRAVIDALEPRVAAGDERILRLRYRLGEALEARLDDPRAALPSYLRVAADDPTSEAAALASIRTAARVQRWDAAARVVVDRSVLAGAPDETLFSALEATAGGTAAWDALCSALEAELAERTGRSVPPSAEGQPPAALSGPVARDLEARLGAWHRDRRGDADAAEAAYTRALAHDPTSADVLRALAQLQRRSRGRPLIDSLLRLSQATGGDLDLLKEAAEVASAVVVDRGLAKTILERLIKVASDRWLGRDDDEPPMTLGSPVHPSEYVEWALAELLRIHNEEGAAERIVELLEQTAALPFERGRSRLLRHEAAEVALSRLGDHDAAMRIWRALFDEDPRDAAAASQLGALYANLGKTDELLDLRQRQLAIAEDPATRAELRLDAAAILRALGRIDEAVLALQGNLTEVPRHARSTLVLSEVLEQAERWDELARFCAEQAALAEGDADPLSAVELWVRAATIADERLGDLAAALASYRRALALQVRPEALDAVARIHERREEWEDAAQHLDRLVREFPERQGAVVVRLADAYVRAGDDAAAQQRLESALAAPGAPPEAAVHLAEIYARTEQHLPLAELTSARAAAAESDAQKLALYKEAAILFMDRCEAPARAVPLLEAATALVPEDRGLKLTLAEALQGAGQTEEARALLRGMIDAFAGRRPKERAQVHFYLARIQLRANERAHALTELEAATRIDPANPEILRMVAELARDDGQLERAERSYRALLAVLRRADDDAPVLRSEVLVELSDIADRQGETERAAEILESAFEAASSSAAEARSLERALRKKGKHAALVRALDARLAQTPEGPQAGEIIGELARVQESLGQTAEALATQLRALGVAPGAPPVHEATLALARRCGAVGAYVDRALELAGAAGKDARLATLLCLRAADALGELGDGARRIEVLQRAEQAGGLRADVLSALDRAYGEAGETEKQEAVLEKLAALQAENTARDPRAAADVLYRLAGLRLRRPDTTADACRMLDSALGLAPDIGRALALAEAALEAFGDDAPGPLLAVYARVARASGNEDAVARAVMSQAAQPGAPADVVREAVGLAMSRGEPAVAERFLRRAVEDEAQDPPFLRWALLELATLREASGERRDALALRLRASGHAEPDEARALREQVARAARTELGDADLAASAYERILDADPADATARAELMAILREAGDGPRLAATIDRVLPHVEAEEERAALRLERARVLATQPERADEVKAELRELLEERPSDVEAATLLVSLLEAAGDTDELTELLGRQLDAAKDREDAATVAALSLRLGRLLEPKDADGARQAYAAGLDWEPGHHDLLLAMLRLLRESGDATDRADVMERLLESEQGPAAESLAVELAALRTEQWDNDGAERALLLGLRAHPASAALRDRLRATYEERGDDRKLADLFLTTAPSLSGAERRGAYLEASRLFGVTGDQAGAARAVRAAWLDEPDDAELLATLVEAMRAREDMDVALEDMAATFARAAGGPHEPMLLELRARLAAGLARHDEALADAERVHALEPARGLGLLAEVLAAAASATEGAARSGLRLRLAAVLAEQGRADEARAALEENLAGDAPDLASLQALAALEEATQQWAAAADAYRRLADAADEAALPDLALHLAEVCERAENLGYARESLERARAAAPADERLLRRLAEVYERTGAERELLELYVAEADATTDPARRFELLLGAGQTLLGKLDDAERAAEVLAAAHGLNPANLECVGLLADALIGLGKLDEAEEALKAAVLAQKGRRSKDLALVYLRLGRVQRARGDRKAETQMLTTGLDMDGQNGEVASELAEVAYEDGNLDLATRALRAITMMRTAAPLPRAVAYERLGAIAAKQGDTKRAVMLLKRAIDDDPSLEHARELLTQLGA